MKLVDQAEALRSMVIETQSATQTKRARVVAITSGKGGVGKSNVAVNLAIRLSKMGRKVVLMDADLGTANIDVLCNVVPKYTLAHVVTGRCELNDVMIDMPGGFRLIPGASGLAKMASLSEFERENLVKQVQQLESDVDVVLIDTGAGVSPNVLSFCLGADQILLVATPEPTSITDAYAVAKAIWREKSDIDVRFLVNMAKDKEIASNVFERMDAVCRKFLDLSIRFAGHIDFDPRVSQAVYNRKPFIIESPNCDAAACIVKLAHRMDRHAVEPTGHGLLKRMRMWLAG